MPTDASDQNRFLPRAILVALLLAALVPLPARAFPSEPGYGVTVDNVALTNPGSVLFTSPEDKTYIISQAGDVQRVLTSPIPNTSIAFARPILNGNLLARLRTPPGNPEILLEMTFAGAPIWTYIPIGYHLHHDQMRISNGDTSRSAIAASRSCRSPRSRSQDDCIIEVNPPATSCGSGRPRSTSPVRLLRPSEGADLDYGGDWAHANAIDVIPANAPTDDPRFRPATSWSASATSTRSR